MIQKKICLLGAPAVGKTSLVARFVRSLFSDKYLTTVGVKVDRKSVQVGGREVVLMLWDLAGESEFQRLELSYLRGAAGCLLVADGTRAATLETAVQIQSRVTRALGKLPFLLVLNKTDLGEEWELDGARLAELASRGWQIQRTSAKDGTGVEDAFTGLARALVDHLAGSA